MRFFFSAFNLRCSINLFIIQRLGRESGRWGPFGSSLLKRYKHRWVNVPRLSKVKTSYCWGVPDQGLALPRPWNLLLGYGRVYTESPSIPGHPDSAGLVQITTRSSSSFCCLWAAPGLSQPRKFLLWLSHPQSGCLLTSVNTATSTYSPSKSPEAKKKSHHVHAVKSRVESEPRISRHFHPTHSSAQLFQLVRFKCQLKKHL